MKAGRLLVSSITGVACAKPPSAATAVARNPLFARAYGPQQFGQLQLALALAFAFAFSSLDLAFSDESGAPMKLLDDEVDISYRFGGVAHETRRGPIHFPKLFAPQSYVKHIGAR
jgi:hypothetical protein